MIVKYRGDPPLSDRTVIYLQAVLQPVKKVHGRWWHEISML